MIVVCGGMQKSGSGWIYNLINDLLTELGLGNARELRDQYSLDFLEFENCHFRQLEPDMIERLLEVDQKGHWIAIKTHRAPQEEVCQWFRDGVAKGIYSFRDPRDVVVSALDHGELIRSRGKTGTFANLENVEKAVNATRNWINIAKAWKAAPNTLCLQYEDVVADTEREFRNIAEFLGLDASPELLRGCVAEYQPRNIEGTKTWRLHFNKGVSGRYKEALSERDQKLCNEKFRDFLQENNYSMD